MLAQTFSPLCSTSSFAFAKSARSWASFCYDRRNLLNFILHYYLQTNDWLISQTQFISYRVKRERNGMGNVSVVRILCSIEMVCIWDPDSGSTSYLHRTANSCLCGKWMLLNCEWVCLPLFVFYAQTVHQFTTNKWKSDFNSFQSECFFFSSLSTETLSLIYNWSVVASN